MQFANNLTAKGDRNAMRKYPEIAKRLAQTNNGFAVSSTKGERNVKAKLSEQDVLQIRNELKKGVKESLLKLLDCLALPEKQFMQLETAKTWTHI